MERKNRIKELENALEACNDICTASNLILEGIEHILDGKEPSDFMLSFGIVRDVYNLQINSRGRS